ncbi:peptidoglycan DD-metalloendopeptidase family protein [uncultured Umboniibacter sp.]|uniref:peptidoglycan DD-metalloendopeptidase family protein n=1 Tax=uncultured Umboniibacter sp. TaxID=1798917 RepID=UPI00260A6C9A|nr:peptidoglycan DD-metalloendopeptidase family protein [uncultured Umboniibacter sp.]
MKKLNGRLVNYVLILFGLCLTACGGAPQLAPVSEVVQPPPDTIDYHYVDQGETYYSIAWRYGLTVTQLLEANDIQQPGVLKVGEKLWLVSRGDSVKHEQIGNRSIALSTSDEALVETLNDDDLTNARSNSPQSTRKSTLLNEHTEQSNFTSVIWGWPAGGPLISSFNTSDRQRRGIDIGGEFGDSIGAAAAGTVVYAGSALKGYGNLVIIKHSEEVLSAYGHNRQLLVQEGQEVQLNQPIAEMGNSDATQVKLHFEIRKNGSPVDPLSYLPRKEF